MKRILAAIFLLWSVGPAAACSDGSVSLKGDFGELRFSVEIADTAQERARGLMFRESMARSAGMLFIFESPQRASFWMKNTLIPLDMLFADKTGTITRIQRDAIPGDLTPLPGGDNVLAVLEINGGLAALYGIEPGAVMRHPAFAQGPAAWPC
jgi:uncharacterized protein